MPRRSFGRQRIYASVTIEWADDDADTGIIDHLNACRPHLKRLGDLNRDLQTLRGNLSEANLG